MFESCRRRVALRRAGDGGTMTWWAWFYLDWGTLGLLGPEATALAWATHWGLMGRES